MKLLLTLFVALLIAGEFRTRRPDGRLIERMHPYRRLMQFVMPSRTESLVYFETKVRAEALEEYLAEARPAFGANITHASVAAVMAGLAKTPQLNRFALGRRLYQRNERWVTFAAKRSKGDAKAALAEVKLRGREGETFAQLCRRINDQIDVERSGVSTAADRQFELFNALPRPVLRGAAAVMKWLDYYNALPGSFIDDDGMYTSCFLANLGSLEMSAAYHHLYEWGNCPLFMMVGAVVDEPVVEDGELAVGRVLTIRWTYDERIADGLTARHGIDRVVEILGDPRRHFGCLGDDDAVPLDGGDPLPRPAVEAAPAAPAEDPMAW